MGDILVSKTALTIARDPNGSQLYLYKGQKVNADALDSDDAERLIDAGFLEKWEPPTATSDDGSDSKPGNVKDILKDVGNDAAKAQEALDAENATAKPRTSLVKKLQAVIDAQD